MILEQDCNVPNSVIIDMRDKRIYILIDSINSSSTIFNVNFIQETYFIPSLKKNIECYLILKTNITIFTSRI